MKRPETVQTKKHEKPKMKKKAVLSRLLPYLMRYKFLMLGAILLTVGGNLLSLAGPYISGLAVDAMELGRGKVNFEKVGCYGVLMVVMYAISAALSYALTRLMIVISRRVVNTMRHDVFQKLSELPVGYETVLEDDGANISKGQKQLMTIARAMLLESSLLILDEATSNVDTRTELRIQKAMRTLMADKTCFVIAHRLSTIRNADMILVVRDGEIVERGTHESLMQGDTFYRHLYNAQFA